MTLRPAVFAILVAVSPTHIIRAQTPVAAAQGYPAYGTAATVTLLNAGAEPRARQRYIVPSTYSEHVKISKQVTMSASMDGRAMPSVPTPDGWFMADIKVTSPAAAAEMTYAVALTLTGRGNDDYKTVTGMVTVNDRGINRAVTFDVSKASSAQMGKLMAAPWENITTPLPEDAIGVGARWEVKQTVSIDAAKAQQKTVYELMSVDGRTLVIKATVEQTGGPQPMANPAMPAGTEASIKDLKGTGTLNIVLHLDALVPTSDSDITRTMAAEISAAGTVMAMTTEVREKLAMAPVK